MRLVVKQSFSLETNCGAQHIVGRNVIHTPTLANIQYYSLLFHIIVKHSIIPSIHTCIHFVERPSSILIFHSSSYTFLVILPIKFLDLGVVHALPSMLTVKTHSYRPFPNTLFYSKQRHGCADRLYFVTSLGANYMSQMKIRLFVEHYHYTPT